MRNGARISRRAVSLSKTDPPMNPPTNRLNRRTVPLTTVVISKNRPEVISGKHVRMNHPPEQGRLELAADLVALDLGSDRTLRPKHRHPVLPLQPPVLVPPFRQAPAHVLVPAPNAPPAAVVQAAQG